MVIMMKNDLSKIIFDNYEVMIKDISILNGGWMNRKYLCHDFNNNKYVIKLFSSKKVEKMSKGEFSLDYLNNQLVNNLKIENYMYDKNLNCEHIKVGKNNKILFPYGDYCLALIDYLNGCHVSREIVDDIQLYNLGKECAKMHFLFKNVDQTPYTGNYLKIPSISNMFDRYEDKVRNTTHSVCSQYQELLYKQREILLLLKEACIVNEIPIFVTHGDFSDDNVLFDGVIPNILDFELVRVNSPLLDIGRIIMSYCYDDNILNYNRIISFMSGYNNIIEIGDKDIFLSFVTVWINEVDMWIKESYFNKKITEKSKRFQEELIYLTNNMLNIVRHYIDDKSLINFCSDYGIKRRILK